MRVRVGDVELGFTERGTGQPVVLIHGLAEDRRHWSLVQERLDNFRTFAYDLRGHGESGLGDADGTLSQLGRDLIGFLESVTGPAQCVGFSLGGTVALWVAATRPELVPGVVVSATSSVVGRSAAQFFRDRSALIQSDFEAFATTLGEDSVKQIVSAEVDLVEVVKERRLSAIGDGHGYTNLAQAMLGMHEHPLTAMLPDIRCPITVVGGSHDVFCPRKAADIMIDALPHATYVEIPNCGHWMPVDQPDVYARTIGDALSGSVPSL